MASANTQSDGWEAAVSSCSQSIASLALIGVGQESGREGLMGIVPGPGGADVSACGVNCSYVHAAGLDVRPLIAAYV